MSDGMDKELLERRLRSALRRVDPGSGLVPGVMARIAAEPPFAKRPPRAGAVASWAALGLIASVILAVLAAHEWQVRRLEQGREARRQLYEALRVTDEKVNLAYRVVNGEEHAAAAEHSGV